MIEREHPLVREAERILALYSSPVLDAIREGLYGPRDAQFALVIIEHATVPFVPAALREVEELKIQLEELRSEKKQLEEQNATDEEALRRLLGEALDIIEGNCSGFASFCDDARAEADL